VHGRELGEGAKQLRGENTKLRKLVADPRVDEGAVQSLVRKTAAARSPSETRISARDSSP
jgi:hypothetical protein